MPRIPRVRGLQSLQLAIAPSSAPTRASFAAARTLSTTCAARGKNTEWVRGKLWKGEAPGPEDPYTQRPEPEDPSNLPEEALEYQPRQDKTPSAVRNSRLALPLRRSEATTEKELKSVDPTYIPATNVQDLEEIGALNTWWDQPGHWGEENEFRGFGSSEKLIEKEVLEVYLRRALVEALSLQGASSSSSWATQKWSKGSRSDLDQALALQIEVQDGKATLKGDASAVVQSLNSEAETLEASENISVDEAKEMVKTWDSAWKDVVVDDHMKFAVRYILFFFFFFWVVGGGLPFLKSTLLTTSTSSANVSINLLATSFPTPSSAPPAPSNTS